MKTENIKTQLFRVFGKELQAAGATKANTKVKLIKNPKFWGSQTFTYLGKLGRRFVGLIPKVVGAAFIIWISIIPLIPKDTPIMAPNNHKPVIVAQAAQPSLATDFPNFPLSGTLQLYVSQYGIKLPPEPKQNTTYDIYPGTHLSIVPSSYAFPANYITMKTGSLSG